MIPRNYLKRIKIHYSISLKNNKKKSIQLWEHIDGMNKNYKNIIASNYVWRAEILKKFLDKLLINHNDDPQNNVISHQFSIISDDLTMNCEKAEWNSEYKLSNEIAMKMLFAMKLVSSMQRRPRIEEALEIIYSLTDEEISFWCWKVLSLKNNALNGFKGMYL